MSVLSHREIAERILRLPPDQQPRAVQAFKLAYEGKILTPEQEDKRESSLSSLKTFIFNAWTTVEPQSPLSWNWHLDEYCLALEEVYYGRIRRLIVNVPPGSAKSIIFSVLYNAWAWAKDPGRQVLAASYSEDLSLRDNLRLRNLVESEWYKRLFGVELVIDQNAKRRFHTTKNGYRIGTSVSGFGTGEHPNFLILIDDPLKAAHARSEQKKREANDWVSKTISTRVLNDPAIILLMQRLAEDDPSGFLIEKGGWEQICFPMRYESRRAEKNDPRTIPDPRDHRTVEGELLWPDKWPEEKVLEEESLLDIMASAQLRQLPVPEGGLLYQRDWFDIVDDIPEAVRLCRGWDIAETDAGEARAKYANWTVGTKVGIGLKSGSVYVIDNTRKQQTLVDDLILTAAKQDGTGCKIREGSGSGKATIKARATLLAGYDYDSTPETSASGDKIQRNTPFRAQAKQRNVKLLRAPWNDTWLNVICNFPLGKCDDDVDSTSNAYNGLVGEPVEEKKKAMWSWG